MREFVKTLSYMKENECMRFFARLGKEKTPCGLYLGIKKQDESGVAQILQTLRDMGLNIDVLLFMGTENCVPVPPTIQGIKTADVRQLPDLAGDVKCILTLCYDWELSLLDSAIRDGIVSIRLVDTGSIGEVARIVYGHLPEIYDTYALLADEESRRAFRGFMSYNVTRRLNDFVFAPESQYFLAGFVPEEGDIAIDGGAYDGGTARAFASLGAKVYSFEMDRFNYAQCAKVAATYGFTAENMGLADEDKVVNYTHFGVGTSYRTSGDEQARFTSVDNYVRVHNLPRIDYIKLDVEGAELDTLKGAARSIAEWKPKMAISAYHRPEDMYTLAAFVRSVRPDYEFAFRHYPIDGLDYLLDDNTKQILREYGSDLFMQTPCESVLYCR